MPGPQGALPEEAKATRDRLGSALVMAAESGADLQGDASSRRWGQLLGALAARAALVDDSGRVTAVNRPWREYAAAVLPDPASLCEGADYLAVCRGVPGEEGEVAGRFARAIQAAMCGRGQAFEEEYDCHAPDGLQWFLGRVTPLEDDGRRMALVTHEDVTERHYLHEQAAILGTVSEWFHDRDALEAVYDDLLALLCERFRFPMAAVEYWDQAAGEMLFVATRGLDAGPQPRRVPAEETISGTVAASGRPVATSQAGRREDYRFPWLRRLGVQSVICTPLRYRHRVLGTLCLGDRAARRDAERLLPTIQVIADHVALELERKRHETRWLDTLQSAHDGVWLVDAASGRIELVNDTYCQMSGYSREELLAMTIQDLDAEEDPEAVRRHCERIVELGSDCFQTRHRRRDGTLLDLEVSVTFDRTENRFFSVLRDVAQRRHLEEEREITIRLLRIINARNDLRGVMHEATSLLRGWFECEAVGIRLREGDDFPYFETRGLSEEFVQAENSLCTRDVQGQLVRDLAGNPILECMCGNVLCGRFDPSKPFFTDQGSFWTNSTSELLASTSEANRQARTRNRCHGEGYESVALVPLRMGGETFGLVQLNDRRKGRFSEATIGLLERLADSLAVALGHRRSEEALRRSEERFRLLVEHSPAMIYLKDEQGRHVLGNPAWARLFGKPPDQLLGTTAFDLFPRQTAEQFAANDRQVFDRNATIDTEKFGLGPDGRMHWWQAVKFPLTGPGGERLLGGFAVDITERRLAEQSLARSEQRFRAIFDTSPLGIALVDPETQRILQANRSIADLLGYSVEELTRLTVMDITHPEDMAKEVESIASVVERTEPSYSIEKRYLCKDGSTRWVHVTATLLASEDGGPELGLGLVEDITERKKIEEALRQNRAVLSNSERLALVGGWGYDFRSGRLRFSDGWHRIHGTLPGSQMTLSELLPIAHPDDMPRVTEALARSAKTGEPYHVQHRILRQDTGEVREVRAYGEVEMGPDGKPARIYGAAQDVTDWARHERSLRESKEHLRGLFDSSPLGIATVRLEDYRFLQVNPALCRMLGYTEDELKRLSVQDVTPAEDLPLDDSGLEEFRAAGRAVRSYEKRLIRKDGVALPVAISSAILYEGHWSPTAVVGFVEDITARKRGEALIHLARDLAVALSSADSLDEGLRRCLEAAARVQGVDAAGIYLVDERTGALDLACHAGLGAEFAAAVGRRERESPSVVAVMRGDPIYTSVEEWAKEDPSLFRAEGLRSIGVVPIRHLGRVIGSVNVASRALDAIPEPAREAVETVAAHAGGAMHRLRAEEAVRETELRIRALFENVPVGFFHSTPEGKFLYVNPAIADTLGYESPQEVVETVNRTSIAEALYEDPSRRPALVAEVASSGGWREYENRYRRKDGQVIDAILSLCELPDPATGRPCLFGFVQDVTERKRAEEAVRENVRLNQILLDGMPCVAMLIRPREHRIVASNRAAAELGAVPGRVCYASFQNRAQPCPWCLEPKVWATGAEQHLEFESGGVIWDTYWSPVSDDLYFHYAFDMTARRRQEEQVEQMRVQLAHLARLSAGGEMLAEIAHEVNQPLYSITNFAKACTNVLASPRPDLARLAEWTREIAAEASRAGEVLRRFRSFVRRGEIQQSEAAIDALIRESIALLGFESRRQSVEIRAETEAGLPLVRIDRLQIQQVLVNLLRNAIEAVEARPVECRTVVVRASHRGGQIKVVVEDRGDGFSAEQAARLFEPFYTTKAHGLGMGLAISRTIVEAHGGRLWAEARPEGGASLNFTLTVSERGG